MGARDQTWLGQSEASLVTPVTNQRPGSEAGPMSSALWEAKWGQEPRLGAPVFSNRGLSEVTRTSDNTEETETTVMVSQV